MIQSSIDLQPFTIPGITDPSSGACGLCFLFFVFSYSLVISSPVLRVLSLSLLISLVHVSPGAAWVRSLYVSAWRTFRMEKRKSENAIF